ncbi:DoxX family protein [Nitrosovibrio tenuis]|uniref:Putative oxidoreductase n=1 Tax=Nitrosovibrio tenuis TaxID=1233 RepID=A0A1H7NTW9_9PROT|nr:DoxX family protein [Nitrosovibrio tenuis]SEL26754.1 putative oxidoreductase [Nitrosovibrio tenuis]
MHNPFRNDNVGKLILRLTAGGLILFHGIFKLLHPESLGSISKMLAGINLPPSLAYGVFLGEVVAPLMVILGFYARLGGLLIFGNMVFALMLAHRTQLFTLTPNGGWALELQAFYLFSGLAVLFLGSGRLALKPD